MRTRGLRASGSAVGRGLRQWWLVLLFLLSWQVAASFGVWNVQLLPSPSSVLTAGARLIASRTLLNDAAVSVFRVLSGFGLAAVVGVVLGVALGTRLQLAGPLRQLIELLRPIPPIAWIPLAILWFGIGNWSSIFIVAVGAFFPIFINTFDGILSVQSAYVNVAYSLGAGRRLLLTDVLLPAALPQILTGMRVGLGIAWTSVIAAELVGAQSGLGYMIQFNRLLLQMENVVAGMVTIGLIGLAMNKLSYRLERYLAPWSADTLRFKAEQV